LSLKTQKAVESIFYKVFLFDEQKDAVSQGLTLLLGLLKALEDMNIPQMTLTHLLQNVGIDPAEVLVLRHRPTELPLRKVLPWLAQEHPAVFNAYQQHHGARLEKALGKLIGKGYVASFIGMNPGEAVFAGLYRIQGSKTVTFEQFWSIPEIKTLLTHRIKGWEKGDREHHEWFDLTTLEAYKGWIGKLSVKWPAPERTWWRRAHKNSFPILAITEESRFVSRFPDWQNLVLTWDQLKVIPRTWRETLKQWRGIYLIHDSLDNRNYIGSAGGIENLIGRWEDYAKKGDGGNKHLIGRNPQTFLFSILERVSPDMSQTDIVLLENSWKQRLHTLHPGGLNHN